MEVSAKTIKEFQDVIAIIEKCQKVKVLVAFISGNTAYGLPEYDSLKRFVYIFVHQQTNDKQMTTFHNGDIEAKGYSVENFVAGLGRCNITRIEIAHYPAFYIGDSDFCKILSALAKLAFPLDGASIQYKYSRKVLKDDYPLYYIIIQPKGISRCMGIYKATIHMSEFKPNEAAEEQANILILETLKKYHRHLVGAQ